MVLDPPVTIPGSRLRDLRRAYGITQEDLAEKLRHTRDTVRAWEQHPALDLRRQRLYRAALNEIERERAS